MNSSKLVTVAAYTYVHEAYVAKAKLESENIPVFLADEHTITVQWLYANALGGVKIQVPAKFAVQAKQLLEDDFSFDVDEKFGEETLTCPHCGSHDVAMVTKGKKPAFVVFLLLGFPLFFIKNGIECADCGSFSKV